MWEQAFVAFVTKQKGVPSGVSRIIRDFVFDSSAKPKIYTVMATSCIDGAVQGCWKTHVRKHGNALSLLPDQAVKRHRDRVFLYDFGPLAGGWIALDEVLALLFGEAPPVVPVIG